MSLQNQHLTRHADLIPIDKAATQPITIIGAGAIGSWVALCLAKSGFTYLTIFDHDTVDEVNMSSQGYRFKDIGSLKVDALQDIISEHVPPEAMATMEFIPFMYEPQSHAAGIIINAADSMEVRQGAYSCIKLSQFNVTHFIDGRMGAEQATMYVTQPHNEGWYLKTMYKDSEAVQERCTAKATIYTASLLSGMIVQAVKQIVCGEPYTKNLQWNIKEGSLDQWKYEQKK